MLCSKPGSNTQPKSVDTRPGAWGAALGHRVEIGGAGGQALGAWPRGPGAVSAQAFRHLRGSRLAWLRSQARS